MTDDIILASGSAIRHQMLANANLIHRQEPANIDEKTLTTTARQQGKNPQDIAQMLASAKAKVVAKANPNSIVIGCDQVLEWQGTLMSKAKDQEQAFQQIKMLSGQRHRLFSAVSVLQSGVSDWGHVGMAELEMREHSDAEIHAYLDRNWQDVRHCVGCYMLEKQGAWLFSQVNGDYFTVLGLPLIQLLGYLSERGVHPE